MQEDLVYKPVNLLLAFKTPLKLNQFTILYYCLLLLVVAFDFCTPREVTAAVSRGAEQSAAAALEVPTACRATQTWA